MELLQNEPLSISHVWNGVGSAGLKQPLKKHRPGLRVGGGAAYVEGCCVCGMPCTGMGVESWLGCPAMSVSSGGVGGSRLSDVGVSCRTSRRCRGWFRLKNSRR